MHWTSYRNSVTAIRFMAAGYGHRQSGIMKEPIIYVFPDAGRGHLHDNTKDPFGKWSKPVNIRPGAGWIDPCPFWDDDGKAYLVAGVAKSRIGYKSVLHMVEMQPDGMGPYW